MSEQHIDPETLVGPHRLMGVAMVTREVASTSYNDDSGNGIAFNLDGIAYVSWEDPNDGYRSSMGALMRVDVSDIRILMEIAGQFGQLGVPVEASMAPSDDHQKNDILILKNTRNGQVVLEVGTSNSNDYYPSAVMCWSPENLATSHKETGQ